MFKNLILVVSLFLSFQLKAQSIHETSEAEIASLVPADYTLAQEYFNFNRAPDADYDSHDTNVSSVVEYDFNKDDLLDLALLVEKPICYNLQADGSCGKESWDWGATDRKLMIFFGQAKGGFKLFLETTEPMLNQGEGGAASPDPLETFFVNQKGSIVLSYWGGSSTKWGHTFKFQYRKVGSASDFYVVGITNMYEDWSRNADDEPNGMLMFETDKNLITGDVIETESLILSEDEDFKEDKVKKYKVKAPLVRLSDATSEFLFGY